MNSVRDDETGDVAILTTDGKVTVAGDCILPLSASTRLEQNTPNPFNPSTEIAYTIAADEHVKITVFDALGRDVEVLVDEFVNAGTHRVTFNARNLPSGIYYYRMETPTFTDMKKMVIAK